VVTVPASSTWVPETRYARNGDVHIAYQVFGGGDVTFVGLPGIISNIEVAWEDPETRRWLTGLGSFCRFVTFDKRGQGLSDRDAGVPTLDERLGDLDSYLPPGRSICELRLLAVDPGERRGRLLPALLAAVWDHSVAHGYDLAVISGITRQQKLYEHLGFVPFGPLIGTREAQFQPMMLTLERFRPRAHTLFGRVE